MSDVAIAEPINAVDDSPISRARSILAANGFKVGDDILREILSAAAVPEPPSEPPIPEIPVSLAMIAAGRNLWRAQPQASVHMLLPALYRAMEQVRRDEAGPTP